MFGFNDIRFSDRVLVIEILADDAIHQSQHQSSDLGSGVGPSLCFDSTCSKKCLRVIKLHVSALLLAAKSQFFHKLFTMESERQCVTLRIHASEETAVMEVLNYMYRGTLTAGTAPALLDVLKAADKFHVAPCMRLCTSLIIKLPMSPESALIYMDLPSSLLMGDEVQPLADAAKQFLAVRYKDTDELECWKEILELPLAGFEAILSSDVLEAASEDHLFDHALKWVETRYPKLEDQRKIFSENLGKYIRFPYMSAEKLREVLRCNILDREFAYKAVIDALFFKTYHHHGESTSTSHRPYVRRAYDWRLIKVLQFESPCQEVVVYFDLTLDQCTNLYPNDMIVSEPFKWGAHPFQLYVHAFGDEERFVEGETSSCFTIGLERWNRALYKPLALDYEFSARSKCTKKFALKKSGSLKFTDEADLIIYETPWLNFKSGKSLDFIDDILYLEVKLRRIMQ